jgi:hypothetical protein
MNKICCGWTSKPDIYIFFLVYAQNEFCYMCSVFPRWSSVEWQGAFRRTGYARLLQRALETVGEKMKNQHKEQVKLQFGFV